MNKLNKLKIYKYKTNIKSLKSNKYLCITSCNYITICNIFCKHFRHGLKVFNEGKTLIGNNYIWLGFTNFDLVDSERLHFENGLTNNKFIIDTSIKCYEDLEKKNKDLKEGK